MTTFLRVKHIAPADYAAAFVETLDAPFKLWEHAFVRQIGGDAQALLLALVTMPEDSHLNSLMAAWLPLVSDEGPPEDSIGIDIRFDTALKVLDGSFVVTDSAHNEIVVAFHSPAILDFIYAYLRDHPAVIFRIIRGLVFNEQCRKLYEVLNSNLKLIKAGSEMALELMSAFARTLVAVPCAAGRWAPYVRSQPIMTRLALYLQLARWLKAPIPGDLVAKWAAAGLEEEQDGPANRSAWVRMVEVMHRHPEVVGHLGPTLPETARRRAVENPVTPDDYAMISELTIEVPGLLSDAELTRLRENFGAFARVYTDAALAESPSYIVLEDDARKLRDAGEALGVAVDDEVGQLEGLAEDLRLHETIEEDRDEYDGPSSDASAGNDIDDMFDGLKQSDRARGND